MSDLLRDSLQKKPVMGRRARRRERRRTGQEKELGKDEV